MQKIYWLKLVRKDSCPEIEDHFVRADKMIKIAPVVEKFLKFRYNALMTFGIISLIIICALIVYLCVNCYLAFFGVAPFIPTPIVAVHEVLKQAKIKKGDIVYDLGAGDGRFLHFAEKDYGAHAIGYEVDPGVFFLAKLRQWFSGWKGTMIRANFKKKDIKNADVIVCYMMTHSLKKLESFFAEQIAGGTRVVSYVFKIGDLKPKKIIPKDEKRGIGRIVVY